MDGQLSEATRVTCLLLEASARNAELLYGLAKALGLLDSREFIDWQDALNAVSVRYEPSAKKL